MAEDGDTSVNNKTLSSDGSVSNKSFVRKVTSRVSGFLPSSLSRWFGSTESQVRYRDETDDDEEEMFQIQPPTKRIKPDDDLQLHTASAPKHNIDVSHNKFNVNSVNHVENKITFPEPIPGPSGYSSRKNFMTGKSSLNRQSYTIQNDVANGDKYSDSSESVTSGYSSMRVGSKETVTESRLEILNDKTDKSRLSFNTSSRVNDRSLFGDRCTSPQQQANSSLSTRQPSFNSSVFGSPNFVDRTLSSKRILSSPFYSGRTTYGGASAYGRNLATASSDYKSAARNTVQIKPIDTTKNNTTLSKTARRILDTLEQYTTPITDAKKIPNPSIRKKHLSSNPYSMRETKVPSNRELLVPTVPDLLKMKLKERLQDSTVSVRQIANSSKSVLNREEYKIRTIQDDNEAPKKHTNKMKNKITSIRQKNEPHRTIAEVVLPDIKLPITTLPKFDFTLPSVEPVKSNSPMTKSVETTKVTTSTLKTVEKVNSTQKCTETNKTERITTTETRKKDNNKTESKKIESKKSESSKLTEFKFSNPLVIAENLKSIRAINNFIFSEPTPTKKEESQKNPAKSNARKSPDAILDMFKRNPDDLLAKFKPSNDTWGCPVCLIRNVNAKSKCAACETPRSQENGTKQQVDKPAVGFGDKFKMSENQWECKICMVVNPTEKIKCAACETPKHGANVNLKVENTNKSETQRVGLIGADKWECPTCLVRNNNSDVKCVACTTPKAIPNGPLKPELKTSQGFGRKFAPPPDTWPCDICAIRNKNDIPKCLACQSPRPAHVKVPSASFGDEFKKKQTQWECDSCMVRNSDELQRCQCCDALKPGAPNVDVPKDKSNLSLFNFGVDPNATLTTKGFSFGIKPSQNKTETTPIQPAFGSNFGQNATTSVITTSVSIPPTFNFGIKSATPEKSEEVQVPQKPVINLDSDKTNTSEKLPQVNPVEIVLKPAGKVEERKEEIKSLNGEIKPSGVLFGVPPTTTTTSATIFNTEPAAPVFSFGASNSAAVSTATTCIFPVTNPTQNTVPVFKFSNKEISQPEKPALFNSTKPASFTNTNTQSPIPAFGAPTTNFFSNNSKPSVFAAPPPTNVGTTSVPVFGADAANRDEPPPAKMPVFSFGQSKKPDSEQPKFGFGAVQSLSTLPAGGFNFAEAPTFDSGNIANQNGSLMFKFGGNAAVPPNKTAFNFGGSVPTTQQQTTNTPNVPPPVGNAGLFNFGFPGSAPAPTPGGFQFKNTTGTDFKPNFNFTTGGPQPPTFSAQPNPGDKPTRVIKKAVRRSQPR